MSEETPSSTHPAIRSDMTVSDYRLEQVERSVKKLTEKFGQFIDKYRDKESSTAIAVERCAVHGTRLDSMEKEMGTLHRRLDSIRIGKPSRLTASAAWGAFATALATAAHAIFGKGP